MEYNDNNINLSEETMELLYRAFGKWTTPERINPELYKEISRHKIDTTEAVAKIYEISETTRFQAKAITEIYEELQYVLQHTTNWEEARDIIQKSAEQKQTPGNIWIHTN
ncbi:hypothetical protein G6F60_002625 [Rhizopus arrhizus]|nr:hypothetical protein G6F60_002625 [Rhizopus arrhizus]